jgi:hypothetical protein
MFKTAPTAKGDWVVSVKVVEPEVMLPIAEFAESAAVLISDVVEPAV